MYRSLRRSVELGYCQAYQYLYQLNLLLITSHIGGGFQMFTAIKQLLDEKNYPIQMALILMALCITSIYLLLPGCDLLNNKWNQRELTWPQLVAVCFSCVFKQLQGLGKLNIYLIVCIQCSIGKTSKELPCE